MTSVSKKTKASDKYWEEFKEFLDEFMGETDRAAVIVGAAKLDLIMYQILQRFLLPSPGGSDDLLEGDSPLSTLSSKINILYRLGLIDASFARALHLVRRIRNGFAHEVTGCDLASGAHRNRVRELIAPLEEYDVFEGIQKHYFATTKRPSADFRTALAILVGRLEAICISTEPLKLFSGSKLIRDKWEKEKTNDKQPE